MSTRRTSISEDAYRALTASSRRGESLSDTVRRLACHRSLTDLAGVMDRRAADAIAIAIEASRRKRTTRRRALDPS